MISFKHSGDAGDVIYSLPVVKALTTEAAYYLSREKFTRVKMSPAIVENFRELLLRQPYIKKVEFYTGQSVCYNFDGFRNLLTPSCFDQRHSLMQYHQRWFGLTDAVSVDPWLTVEPKPVAEVVVNRSSRYRNEHFPWRKVLDKYGSRAVFIGRSAEHRAFQEEWGFKIPYVPTSSLYECAQILAGSKLFIGNQSCPCAIAEGLKINSILEVALWLHSACTARPGSQHVYGARVELPDI